MEKVDKKTGEILSKDQTSAPSHGKHALVFHKPSRTKQFFKSEVNINTIMAKARQVGHLPPPHRQPIFADASNILSYEEAHNIVRTAHQAFMKLPAVVRERMGNNPRNLPSYLTDPANFKEAVKFGLIKTRDKSNDAPKNVSSPSPSSTPTAPPQPPPSKP